MKEQIMAKLFDGKELNSEELLYVGRNLSDSNQNAMGYNHEITNTLEACGVTRGDFDEINKMLQTNIEEKKKDFKGVSEYVEKFEMIALSSPKNLRLIILNYMRLMSQSQHPLGGLLAMLGKI